MFSLVIKATNRPTKLLLKLRIDLILCNKERCTLIHEWTMKNQLDYLKHKNKKIHKMSKDVVTILSTLNTTMCHAFIQFFFINVSPFEFHFKFIKRGKYIAWKQWDSIDNLMIIIKLINQLNFDAWLDSKQK